MLVGAGDGWLLGRADGAKEGAGVGLLEVGALVGVRVGTDDGKKLGRPDGTGLGTAVGSVEGPSVGTDVGSWRIANFSLKSYTGVTISSFESPLHTILMVYESPQCVSLLSVLIVVRVVGRG